MEAVGRLILFLFVLFIGKSPAALREFSQIKGEWIVVNAETGGEKVPVEARAKKVIFLSSTEMKKQPVNSVVYSGHLKMDRSPKLIELSSLSILVERPPISSTPTGNKSLPAKPVAPIKQSQKSFVIYQVTGGTMKLLLKPTTASNTEPPKDFVTTKEGGELLLELRRNLKKNSLHPAKPKRQSEKEAE